MLIAEIAFPVPIRRSFHYMVPDGLRDLKPGTRVRAPFGPRQMTGTVLSVVEGQPERALKSILAATDPGPVLPEEMITCGRWMARRYCAPIGECMRALLPSFVRHPDAAGRRTSPPRAAAFSPEESPFREPEASSFTLTDGQDEALKALLETLRSRTYQAALLFGVPASGKTEVYFRLLEEATKDGGQAMFLLPEISLTTPFFEEFSRRLGGSVVLWHSKLTVPQRREAWGALRSGSVRVVVGARSAALLPLPSLRLVVVDEEQDESFKQESPQPFYHAREVALERARMHGALAVLGSATPSLETWQEAREGRARLYVMRERVCCKERPEVSVVPKPDGEQCLSPEMTDKLRDRLCRGEQSILLVNRRGFSTLVMCRKCGWVDRCPDCGVALIRHFGGASHSKMLEGTVPSMILERDASGQGRSSREAGQSLPFADGKGTSPEGTLLIPEGADEFAMRCHHCGRKSPVKAVCGICKDTTLWITGTGTQKVAAEVKAKVPGARVLRMDRDSLKETAADRKILATFLGRKADILVGTKLVAKSFHFPAVTFVGVVDADTMVHMPDFRASERTMQLLSQVAGRSGRGEQRGEVMIQTMHPAHAAMSSTKLGDYEAFALGELSVRRELGYPPFASLIRLELAGRSEKAVEDAAESMAEGVEALVGEGHQVLGPAPGIPPVSRGRHRKHLLLKVLDPARTGATLDKLQEARPASGVKLRIVVDPYDLG